MSTAHALAVTVEKWADVLSTASANEDHSAVMGAYRELIEAAEALVIPTLAAGFVAGSFDSRYVARETYALASGQAARELAKA